MDILDLTDEQKELAGKLDGRELMFCNLYLTKPEHGLSRARCYMKAGYKTKTLQTASVESGRLLKRPRPWAYCQAMRNESVANTGLTLEYLDTELKKIIDGTAPEVVGSYARMTAVIDSETGLPVIVHHPVLRCAVDDLPEEVQAAIQSIKMTSNGVEVKMYSRLDAMKLAYQRQGALTESHQHTGKDGAPIERIERIIIESPTATDS